jgi:predicted DNA-binding transcriptional regulator AlpA
MTTKTPPTNEPALIDVKAVAALLGCSTRHVTRLEDAQQIPPAIKLGRLSRWQREVILAWIAAGCPDCATWEKLQVKA